MFKHSNKKWFGLFSGLLFLAFTFFVQQNNSIPWLSVFLNRINGVIYDNIIKWNSHKPSSPVRVVVIDIDDYSIQSQGRWPWPRDKLAKLLTELHKAGIVVTAFDIVISEPETNYASGLKEKIRHLNDTKSLQSTLFPLLDKIKPMVDNDTIFFKALTQYDVVLGYLFHHDASIKKGALPEALFDNNQLMIPTYSGYNGNFNLFLKAAPHSGFVSNRPDIDGVMRHGLLLANYNNHIYPSLVTATLMRFLLADKLTLVTEIKNNQTILKGINIGGMIIPTTHESQLLIPFFGPPNSIDSYSAGDVLEGKLPANSLAGGIAIVGSSMILLADRHQSPVSPSFPGVEMNANMITEILANHLITEFNWQTLLGQSLFIVLGLVCAIVFPFLGPILLPSLFVICVFSALLLSFLLLIYYNVYVDMTMILLLISLQAITNFIYAFMLERRQKNSIKQLFGQYVPPSYIEEITNHPDQYNTEGKMRDMTVFFADIRGFTGISELLNASELKHLLNTVFTPMTAIIFEHQGTIDKYVGDMIMAFWGAPLTDHKHYYHGISAALSIKQELKTINNTLKQQGLPLIKIGMGLSTGLMNVGDMGSTFRFSYTVIGKTVNLASRLQDLTKFYQVDILTNADTLFEGDETIVWRPIDKVIVKGTTQALMIFEPIGYHKDCSEALIAELEQYNRALLAYFDQDWELANQQFQALSKANPSYYLYQLYLTRIEEFFHHPPDNNWNGAYAHTHK